MTVTTAERLAVVETKLGAVETKVDGLHIKLDSFIECADKKYAEKARVRDIEERVNAHETRLAYYAGAVGVIFVVVQLAIKHFLG